MYGSNIGWTEEKYNVSTVAMEKATIYHFENVQVMILHSDNSNYPFSYLDKIHTLIEYFWKLEHFMKVTTILTWPITLPTILRILIAGFYIALFLVRKAMQNIE